MKWILVAVGVLVLIVAVVAVIGALLPQDHIASRSADFKQPPEALWTAITDVSAYPSWRPGIKSLEGLPDREGRKAWRETGSDGAITFELMEAEPPRRLIVRIADPDLPFGGSWTYEIGGSDSSSTLKITENGEVYNVFFRFMSRFVFGHHRTLETYLHALGRKFGETVEVR